MKATKEMIIGAIITLLVVSLLGGFIATYLTSDKPILFSDKRCDRYLQGPEDKYDFSLQNRAENTGLAKICFYVDNAFFRSKEDLLHQICLSESKISPKSAELQHNFNPKIVFDNDLLEGKNNISVNISVECSQKIWSLIRRRCDDRKFTCTYSKEWGDTYRLIQ